MKRSYPYNFLSLGALFAGVSGLILRLWLIKGGTDEKGLLLPSHPAAVILPLMCVAVLALLAFFTKVPGNESYQKRFSASRIASAFLFMAALGLLLFSLLTRPTAGAAVPGFLFTLLGILSGLSLLFLAYCRMQARRPSPLFHGVLTVFLMAFLLSRYPLWSSQPQLLKSSFDALAAIVLLLAAYYRTTLDAKMKTWKLFQFFHLAAFFLCFLGLSGDDRLFYLSMLFWSGADLSLRSAVPLPHRTEMTLPAPVRGCIRALEKAGFAAYAVGGCVRDSLLGLTPKDYDLCTSATPEDICRVFSGKHLVRSGEKHGTIGVVIDGTVYEITTFRAEGAYSDNRHPDWVAFVSNVEDDLLRRDFTVNAMAYAPGKGYIDRSGGIEDLKNRVLRTVGDPETRFREDALRILRGIRFAVRFGLTPEKSTLSAMIRLAPLMDNLARERVFDELCKLLPLVTAQDLLTYAPILTQVIPELAPCVDFQQHSVHHIHDVYTHTANVVAAVPQDLSLRWAALLHDIGKPQVFTLDEAGQGHFRDHARVSAQMAERILLRLKAPNQLREQVVFLVRQHMTLQEPERKLLLRRMGAWGEENLRKLLILQKADFGGKGTGEEPDIFAQAEAIIIQLTQEKACLSGKDLAINGRDILALGIEPGPLVGDCMRRLLELVQEEAVPNTKEALTAAAADFLSGSAELPAILLAEAEAKDGQEEA